MAVVITDLSIPMMTWSYFSSRTLVEKKLLKCMCMDKLKLTGLNLGGGFNSRIGCMCAVH